MGQTPTFPTPTKAPQLLGDDDCSPLSEFVAIEDAAAAEAEREQIDEVVARAMDRIYRRGGRNTTKRERRMRTRRGRRA